MNQKDDPAQVESEVQFRLAQALRTLPANAPALTRGRIIAQALRSVPARRRTLAEMLKP